MLTGVKTRKQKRLPGCQTVRMGGTHQDPGVHIRAPQEVRQAAIDNANAAGWTLQDVLLACLHAMRHKPGELLAFLAPHRQPARPTGRPRKAERRTD